MSVAIVGFAGAHVPQSAPPLNRALFDAMIRRAEEIITERFGLEWDGVRLVSGGAAWSDHVAVHCHQRHSAETSLIVWAPCGLTSLGRFADTRVRSRSNPGGLANRLHESFARLTGIDSFNDLRKVHSCVDSSQAGFHARNGAIARSCDYMIAFSWATGDAPDTGGTLDVWTRCPLEAGTRKIHVPMDTLVPRPEKRRHADGGQS